MNPVRTRRLLSALAVLPLLLQPATAASLERLDGRSDVESRAVGDAGAVDLPTDVAAQPLRKPGAGVTRPNIALAPTARPGRMTAAALLPAEVSGMAPVAGAGPITALPANATSQPLAAPAVRASLAVTTPAGAIELELGKGTLVRLRQPAATVFIANPET